jgi:hypothetical protein
MACSGTALLYLPPRPVVSNLLPRPVVCISVVAISKRFSKSFSVNRVPHGQTAKILINLQVIRGKISLETIAPRSMLGWLSPEVLEPSNSGLTHKTGNSGVIKSVASLSLSDFVYRDSIRKMWVHFIFWRRTVWTWLVFWDVPWYNIVYTVSFCKTTQCNTQKTSSCVVFYL